MANYTPNFNLMKPLGSEKYNVSQQNGNMDKIDTSLNALGNGLGIIANGNTHAAISSGDYVYVHGHGTLAEGLYQATANIAANGTLTSSNLSFKPNGIGGDVSALNSNTIKNNVDDQQIQNPTTGGSTTLRVKSNATSGSEAFMRADSEGGNFQAKKGNSVIEIDSNGLKDDGTGYGRIYTTADGSNVKSFQFKQNGDFVDGNSGKTVRSVEKSITTAADGHYAISNIAAGLTIANIVNVIVTNAAYSALTFVFNGSGYLQFVNTSGQILTSAQTFTIKAYFVS